MIFHPPLNADSTDAPVYVGGECFFVREQLQGVIEYLITGWRTCIIVLLLFFYKRVKNEEKYTSR